MSEKLILALVFVFTALVAAILLAYRLNREDYKEFGNGKGIVVIIFFLFVSIISALYAFLEKEWTADLLKILIGIIAGGTTGVAATSVTQSITGNNNFQAVNAQIEKLNSDMASFKTTTAEKIDNITNITQNGFARFTSADDTYFHIGRVRFRCTRKTHANIFDRLGAYTPLEIVEKASFDRNDPLINGMGTHELFALAFFQIKEFKESLKEFIKEINDSGYVILSQEGWDNVEGGIEFYFNIGKNLN